MRGSEINIRPTYATTLQCCCCGSVSKPGPNYRLLGGGKSNTVAMSNRWEALICAYRYDTQDLSFAGKTCCGCRWRSIAGKAGLPQAQTLVCGDVCGTWRLRRA
jgi:hypothetical protein